MPDTIFALSSGRPPAGIAIIRICGPLAHCIHKAFTGIGDLGSPRFARLVALRDPQSGEWLDEALSMHFLAPASATGEDMVEWHCHGGQAVVHAVLSALQRQHGLREAQPGEFTRRAFANGRIDLNEAEGLADLLAAETEAQRRAAGNMARGHFSRVLAQWRGDLLTLSAAVESELDFSDEGDVASSECFADKLRGDIASLSNDVRLVLSAPHAERLREGIRVVLAGPPNAGKSTLLNALVGREAAIVSDIAGTTRDRIDAVVAIDGVPFVFTDTAGLRDGGEADAIELIGMERAEQAIAEADILLWLGEPAFTPRADALRIAPQCDRPDWCFPAGADLAVSAVTGEGMQALVRLLLDRTQAWIPGESEMALHARQREGLAEMSDALERATRHQDDLLIAEELRIALRAIDRLTGKAGVEDMLDTLFGRFCIGK